MRIFDRTANTGSWPGPLLLPCVLVGLATAKADSADRYAAARDQMVQTQVVEMGIRDPRVIRAMRVTPRHEFLEGRQRQYAYFDMAIPIGHGQTISSPYIVAFMTEQLDPQPTDKVLEVGTGSGYQAAVLSPLVDQVYSIEIVAPLGRRAAATLRRLRYTNVHTKIGDGFQGWSDQAPFDKIIVTCSPENVPGPLIRQLAEGGRMVVPVGERFQQTLCLFTKTGGQLKRHALQATFFVPMTGSAEQRRQIKPGTVFTPLVHGSFEQTAEGSDEPAGWFYVRQGRVVADPQAPVGKKCLAFANSTPGRNAWAMQAFGVDGRKVRNLQISLWVRGRNLRPGQSRPQQPNAIIEFYNASRAPVADATLGPWLNSFDWIEVKQRIRVPPTARLATLGIGLFGATGEAWFDGVKLALAAEKSR